MRFLRIVSLLAHDGAVKQSLCLSVSACKEQFLEAGYALAEHVGVYAYHQLHAHACLWHVCVISHKTYWKFALLRVGTDGKAIGELVVDGVEYVAPAYAVVLHETIEHILLAGENPVLHKNRVIDIGCCKEKAGNSLSLYCPNKRYEYQLCLSCTWSEGL